MAKVGRTAESRLLAPRCGRPREVGRALNGSQGATAERRPRELRRTKEPRRAGPATRNNEQPPLKIALIEPVGGHCGMDYYDFGLARGLAAAGADVVLHTCDETQKPANANFRVRYSYRKIYGDSARAVRGLRFLCGTIAVLVSALLERRKVTHFHLFHAGVPELVNITLAKLFGRKIVITGHDVSSFVDSLEKPRIRKLVYRMADLVIAHNQISKSELIEKVDISESKIQIVRHGNYLGLVPELPPQAEARQRFGIREDAPTVLYFGQIKKDVKGVDVLLRAMPFVLRRLPDAKLLIAGKPWKMDFSPYQQIIDELGLEQSCVKQVRYIEPEEVGYFFSAADVVALPYRRIYQSGVILKAMTYGKAVVVSDLPGFLEVVEDGRTGFVFKSDDPESLGERLCAALGDDAKRDEVAKAGARHVFERFDWDQTGRETLGLYRRIL